ncbi:hypothetical protein GCK72_012716 [Caenorhabditis remanei]|uniref:CUT domain-containing protein n=1 Tax=Caenorhabditis remanei TaxID=31234 RepID=A0A6A5GNX2_CAERE|nr:hypothetical protein GCK72_012716 [Caenorhabditis remanei]KAF1756263.1 hypothetical protein GCK72_012716 [Caenorhabditis remanei]
MSNMYPQNPNDQPGQRRSNRQNPPQNRTPPPPIEQLNPPWNPHLGAQQWTSQSQIVAPNMHQPMANMDPRNPDTQPGGMEQNQPDAFPNPQLPFLRELHMQPYQPEVVPEEYQPQYLSTRANYTSSSHSLSTPPLQTQTHPTNNINTEGYPPFTFGENYAQNARLMTAGGFEMGGLADMRHNPNPQDLEKPLGDGERIDTAEVARKITNLINNTPSGKGKYFECVGGKMKNYKKYIDVFYDLKEYKELNEEGQDVFRRWYNWWNIPDDEKRKSILNMHETLKTEWFNMRSAKNAERIENKLKLRNQELKRKSDAVDEKNRVREEKNARKKEEKKKTREEKALMKGRK